VEEKKEETKEVVKEESKVKQKEKSKKKEYIRVQVSLREYNQDKFEIFRVNNIRQF
jgi:hypothetical protein